MSKMSEPKITSDCLKRVCRTCLSTVNKLKSFKQNQDLLTMLTQLTPIKPEEDDMFPKQICVVCISRLNIVYNFIEMCQKAQSDLKQAIEEDNQTLLNHLRAMENEPPETDETDSSDSDSENDSILVEHLNSEDEANSFTFSLPEDDLFECEEHKLKVEESKGDVSNIQIVNVVSVPEEANIGEGSSGINHEISDSGNVSFKGFNSEEILITKNNLEKYTETVQTVAKPQNTCPENKFFNSIRFKCYLCENKLNLKNDKRDIKTLEFSTLNDDAHILCKKRVQVLQKVIKDLYMKQDEYSSLNRTWQNIFLQKGNENGNDLRIAQPPINPVSAKDREAKPHEIGYKRDGQVHAGHLTWISENDFNKAFRCSLGLHKFLTNMALAIFGADTLAKSTITGASKYGVKKIPLNSIRMCALKSSLKYYMKEHNVPDYYQERIWKNFNKILAQKIFQISSQHKRRCSGELPSKNRYKKARKI